MGGIGKWAWLVGVFLLGGLMFSSFHPDDFKTTLPSTIVDKEGEVLVRLDREHRREEILIEAVPDHVIHAFIAIEDARFYEHRGIDLRGIARAAASNFRETGNPFRGSQGGSTITQQLVKNTLLSPKRSVFRKIQEAWLALRLERTYTKEEILELYLNYATYFHHNNYGIQAASMFYFDRDTSELTLEEGALLAGIIRHPSRLSPHENPEQSKARQETVLRAMREEGFISGSEYAEAIGRPLEEMLAPIPAREFIYPHFVDYVIYEEVLPILRGKLGSRELPGNVEDAENLLYFHGLTIHTTLDQELQEHAEQVINNPANYPATWTDEAGIIQPQGALVVSEPYTGQIRAMAGGRDYGYHNMINRATSLRSPGSALKPIIAYAPAMEEGYLSPASVLEDTPTTWSVNGQEYEPKNFSGTYSGLITARHALVHSLNVPAVKVYNDLLEKKTGFQYAQNFGISTFDESDRLNPAAALGGLLNGVKPLELTEAYAALANQGIRIKHHAVTKIVDRQGNVIYEYQPESRAVVSPETAWLVTDILKDAALHGTASSLRLHFPVAAKTGTSQDFRDAWLVAYTPELVTTFWLGYDWGNIPVDNRTRYTTAVVRSVMLQALEGTAPSDFEKPDGVVGPVNICRVSGLLPSSYTPSSYIIADYFHENRVPTQVCSHFDRWQFVPPEEDEEMEDETEETGEDKEEMEESEEIEESEGDKTQDQLKEPAEREGERREKEEEMGAEEHKEKVEETEEGPEA